MLNALLLILIFMTSCQQPLANRDSNGSSIVCLGDSLTAGFGANPGHDYPSLLRTWIDLPVINAGVSGNTTQDALQRLDHDVLSHDPRIVIIILGANDYFRAVPQEQTMANLKQIIDKIKKRGSMVVLAEVQMRPLNDPYIDAFRKLADKEHILLVPNILSGIEDHPQYKSDQIHPNDAGYQIMAERIYQQIKGLITEGD